MTTAPRDGDDPAGTVETRTVGWGQDHGQDDGGDATATADLPGEVSTQVSATAVLRMRPEAVTLDRGVTVGRYVLIDRVGKGGMGVVYKAYDPELDRPVAIKLVHGSSAGGRDRLLREAQALARLSHPNVVSVFDVGTFGDDVYLAMEFVSGQTLRAWLDRERPKRAAIVATFRAAGEGLAAAHRAGLVHRDVKPDNIVVGDDGRVRVLDFGLARTAAGSRASQPSMSGMSGPMPAPKGSSPRLSASGLGDDSEASGEGRLSSPLTQIGSVIGTPRYMAPEQHDGGEVDARTDQFAFCVSLYEALYGQRPFAGRTRRELAESVRAGVLAAPPAEARVPRWLRQIVLRGLAPDPAARFASMDQLLAALRRDPARRRRRIAAVAVPAALAIGVVAWAGDRAAPVRCGGAEAHLRGIWDGERRQTVRAAFAATGVRYAGDVSRAVEAALDGYTSRWTRMRTEACQATHVRGEQSEELLDLRMACLDQRLDGLDAQVRIFAGADATVVEHAAEAAELPGLEACADAAALRAPVPLPADVAVRARVAAVGRQVTQARALFRAGKVRDAETGAQQALLAARTTGHAPLVASAALLLGDAAGDLGDLDLAEGAIRDGLASATAGHDDRAVAEAWRAYLWHLGEERGHFAEALRWEPVARAAVARLRNAQSDQALLDDVLAHLYFRAGQFEPALTHVRAALAALEHLGYTERLQYAQALATLANILDTRGDADEAQAAYEQAMALSERLYGPTHPNLGSVAMNLGTLHFGRGHYDQALALYQRALALYESGGAEGTPDIADAELNIATVYTVQGRYPEAVTRYRKALAIMERVRGPDAADVAHILLDYGETLLEQGQAAAARPMIERAVRIWSATVGDDHAYLAYGYAALGRALVVGGDPAAAMAPYRRALDIARRELGADHAEVGTVLTRMGEAELALGQPSARATLERGLAVIEKAEGADHPDLVPTLRALARAMSAAESRPVLERLVAILERGPAPPAQVADAELALARALPPSARERARALAAQARARSAALGDAAGVRAADALLR